MRRFQNYTTEELIDELAAQKELMKNSRHKSNQGICRIYDLEDELDYRENEEILKGLGANDEDGTPIWEGDNL